MKKSLIEAMVEAEAHSKKFPEILVRVMDKKGKRALITASEWVYKERVLSGWFTVATYKNGERLGA